MTGLQYRNKDWLEDQYWNKEKSQNQIAKECNVAPITIGRNMEKFNIPKRSLSEATKGINKGDKHGNWKGGRSEVNGYIYLYKPEHHKSTQKGYVLEHILVVEEKLGRYLEPGEVVHHINGIKDDNCSENLIVCDNQSKHRKSENSLLKCLPLLLKNGYLIFNKKKKIYEVIC